MKRYDCLEALSAIIEDDLVVIGMTGQHWEWNSLLPGHEGNIKVPSLGNATAAGCGMAMSLPHRRVVVLDSDGSTLFDLPTVMTLGTYRPENLKVFVFDNEVYSGSRISEPSATAFKADLGAIATGGGIPDVATVTTLDGFKQRAEKCMTEAGIGYTVVKVDEDVTSRSLPKPTMDYLEYKYRFVRYIERTESRSILRPLQA